MKELQVFILSENLFQLSWEESLDNYSEKEIKLQEDLFNEFNKDVSSFLFHLGFSNNTINLPNGLSFLRIISNRFLSKLIKTENLEEIREKVFIELEGNEIEELLFNSPFIPGNEFLTINFIKFICERLNKEYQNQIKTYSGTVENFFKSLGTDFHIAGKIYFHLVESKKEETPFAFLATYTKETQHIPLKNALIEYGEDSKKLLSLISTIHTAARESNLIKEFLESGEIFHPLNLTSMEALCILKEIPLYEKSGIICRIPNWWKYKSRSARLNIKIGDTNPGFVGMDALLDFNAEILLGGEKITIAEAKELLTKSEGLAFIKGKWVEVDNEKLKETLKAYERALKLSGAGLTLIDAMKLQFESGSILGLSTDEIEISNGKWFEDFSHKLKNHEKIESVELSNDFKAKLRDYQKKGLNWLSFMNKIGLGCCLADDMGLGKTVQLLALCTSLKNTGKLCNLLIIPASLITNWITEITRFAPSIRYFIAHSSFSKIDEITFNENSLKGYDLVITTYTFVVKNENILKANWNIVILDEAQNIKNPDTKQTKTVKKLNSKNRIAMTGTPIENRLSDLWSLFDFINPGLLGNQKKFSDFSNSLKNDSHGYSKLKKIVSPFILRRLKTDKSIISDLPDKVEMKTFADLTKKQIILYEKQVKELLNHLDKTEDGIAKKGLILSSLMKFKQLCNHPDQFLGLNEYAEGDSGKFERLKEICETIYEKREKVLVFSQFAEITGHLSKYLSSIFHHEGVVLHGGIPVNKRKEIVEKFQSHEYVPFMVLSLKAGGIGLNLTEANHVIHFDRWWNPAVENQATDRAFRIGQKKNVMAHKFITRGTIEEKIDQMIESKKALSNEIIGETGESWITELSNSELKNLFSLSI